MTILDHLLPAPYTRICGDSCLLLTANCLLMTNPLVQHALISVSDKTGLAEFAKGLAEAGVEIFSTGGTQKFLIAAGIEARDVARYTGFPEMMEGRVKTLHPKIFGGILCRRDHAEDMASVEEHEIATFELVVVNLYPFAATIAKPGVSSEEAIENIDIGGPSLVRAAAKNHAFVAIVTSPRQYGEVLAEISKDKATSFSLRQKLAGAAYAHTAEYDTAIAAWFASRGRESFASTRSPRRRRARPASRWMATAISSSSGQAPLRPAARVSMC